MRDEPSKKRDRHRVREPIEPRRSLGRPVLSGNFRDQLGLCDLSHQKFLPAPNGLRFSGERERVRCTRVLGDPFIRDLVYAHDGDFSGTTTGR